MTALNLYKFISSLSLPLILIGFAWRSLNQQAYRQRLKERLGLIKGLKPGGIIIHAASVGEVIALKPFIEMTLENLADTPLTITTFTPTGSERVMKTFGGRVQHCYIPIDAPACISQFLSTLKPKVLVIMETELWPSLIDGCHKQQVKTLLINGRISPRSFPRYQKIPSLIQPTLNKLDYILTQSDDDRERFSLLGAQANTLQTMGNIKYDISAPNSERSPNAKLRILSLQRKVWVVGSTHSDEEALILACFKKLQQHIPDIILVIAPRHPERVQRLIELADSLGLSTILRSEKTQPTRQHDIWLIDTMGELLDFYRIANVCTVAGSFGETGGHNPIEPALFHKPIVVGTNMDNFRDITAEMLASEGLIQLAEDSIDALQDAIFQLFEETETSEILGRNAHSVLEKNQGATNVAFQKLTGLLG